MIKTKERLEDNAKQRNKELLEKTNEKKELQGHLKVAETMRQIFMDRSSRVMHLGELIEQLQSRIYG